MTEDVLLSVKGLQVMEEAQEESIEVVTPGHYRFQNGKHYISYEEAVEGSKEKIQNLIKISEEVVEVTKRGFSNTHLVFEKHKRNVSYYDTPFGKFLVSILAKDIQIAEDQGEIKTRVEYSLEINYEYMADCSIQIQIASKDGKAFHLCD
ncbi:MAG: DUF1934 domain-containing protein [Lachnospiraceae bacterium]|nr:DUF1934 domain-containing protein [Robinsoniella sp.]MDY3765501.1 DUF1934 domain-containing protein [Lachnospiraceae bacterium]